VTKPRTSYRKQTGELAEPTITTNIVTSVTTVTTTGNIGSSVLAQSRRRAQGPLFPRALQLAAIRFP
jgi:hypothetical protein